MRVVLFLSSVACIALTGAHAWRENLSPEWRGYQQRYAQHLAEMAQTDRERSAARDYEVKFRQVVLPDGAATDRCVSCHVATDDRRMADQPEPLRAHPGDYLDTHPVERFGCTTCHDGQGQAITWADAAAYERERFWEKPLLKAPFIEANCYRCHSEVLDQTPTYAFGKQIFDQSGCTGCHTVRGTGAAVGPDLTMVADLSRHVKVPTAQHHDLIERFTGNETLAYLFEAVKWPEAQPTPTKMPQFNLSDEEATALIVYLKSLGRRATATGLLPPPKPVLPPTDVVERGRVLYGQYCIGCHGQAAEGGISNANAPNPTIRPLNTLAETMSFATSHDVEAFLGVVRGLGGQPIASSAANALPNWPTIEAAMANARKAITEGQAVQAVTPSGPQPLGMPGWRHLLDDGQVEALIAYLVSTAKLPNLATGSATR
jgi:mono/diheme cytochrome c family protein/cytochrome c553